MTMEQTKRPKIVTSALISKHNKILLIKRKKAPEINKWALSGGIGSFDRYPNPELAVQDEVRYDLGVKFNVQSFYNYSFYVNEDGPSVVLHFLGTISGKIEPNQNEVLEWKFFSKEDLENMSEKDFAFDHYQVLKNYFKKDVDTTKMEDQNDIILHKSQERNFLPFRNQREISKAIQLQKTGKANIRAS